MKLNFDDSIKAAIAIVVWTFIVFSPSLKNDFVYYDDVQFVSSPYTQHLSWKNFKESILNRNGDVSMFPLVIFSYAIEYHFFKDNPWVYHVDNLALHLTNVLFVYMLIYLISGRLSLAFLTTILFAINPLRVESVAWIAERKDLLFSFFYLLSLIMYLCAEKNAALKLRFLFLSCAFFILSLLSKPQALSLPLVILAIDFLVGKGEYKGRWIEKTPFLMIAVVFFIFFIHPHVHLLKPTDPRVANDIERIFLSCGAVLVYFLKNFIPYQLSCVNPFPHKTDGYFSWIIYAAPIILFGSGYLFYRFFHKERFIIFGLLFFLINLIMPVRLIWYNWFIGEH